MYRSGRFVAAHVEPTTDEQRQPNGVDLTLDAVFTIESPGRIGREGKELGDRRPVEPTVAEGAGERYRLTPGGYVVRYGETVHIPDGHVGFIYPRSSLLRNGAMVNTAVWDAGYRGRGEGLVQVHHPIVLERSARIAQLVLARADHEGTYDGDYQGENLE